MHADGGSRGNGERAAGSASEKRLGVMVVQAEIVTVAHVRTWTIRVLLQCGDVEMQKLSTVRETLQKTEK